jgi:hypothetical protein
MKSEPLHQCKFIKLNGISYHRGMYVVLNFDYDDSLVFGRIECIFIQKSN